MCLRVPHEDEITTLASEKGDEDKDAERPGEWPSRLEEPGGVVEPDHRGDVGVDHGERRVESNELAGEEGESSRPPRRATLTPAWRGIGSRIVRNERSSSSSSSELS